jgi:hypothetical protein
LVCSAGAAEGRALGGLGGRCGAGAGAVVAAAATASGAAGFSALAGCGIVSCVFGINLRLSSSFLSRFLCLSIAIRFLLFISIPLF